LLYGARVSLVVGLGSTAVALLIGTPIGMAAGYFRGRVDGGISVLTDAFLAFPPLVFLLALVTVLEPSLSTIFVAFALLGIPTVVRLARANSLSLTEREFVIAARSLGARPRRVLFREILPNLAVPLLSFSMVIVAALILGEASLSFLGLGIKAPQPSWGNMIAESQTVLTDHPHAILVPAFTLFLTVVAFNRLGEAARMRWDTRTSAM
jgi:peptide/nickel transport system permease protein